MDCECDWAVTVCVTQVHIESEQHEVGAEKPAEVDFFDEHSSAPFEQSAPPKPDNQYSAAAQLSAPEVSLLTLSPSHSDPPAGQLSTPLQGESAHTLTVSP